MLEVNDLRNSLRAAVCFILLLGLVHMASAESLRWVPVDERVSIDISSGLATLDGRSLKLSELEGKAIFLNFWATWCAPCRKEMPDMERMHQELSEMGLVVVAVSDDAADDVHGFLKKNPYSFQFLIDPDGALAHSLEVPMLPTTMIIDKRGRLALTHLGAFDWDSPEALSGLKGLVAE